MDIVFATTNRGKVSEVKKMLKGINVLSMSDIGIDVDVVEDGTTFEENALKKAMEIEKLCGKNVIADDSGLEVDFLNGQPGIYSARFMGKDTPQEIKNNKILELLKDTKGSVRSAHFICAMAIAFSNGETFVTRGVFDGEISEVALGSYGFGYDPIFLIPYLGKTLAELPPEAKNEISHRKKALEEVKKKLSLEGLL